MISNAQSALQIDWATATSMVLVVLATTVALRLLRISVRGISRGVLQRDHELEREATQKAKTLSQVAETTGRIVIFTLAGLTIFTLSGRDITPLLASAGIAGVAIGFGAQNLIKDWLSGFFILLENQYSVDDVIKVGEHSGTVERLELRRTVLRNLEGSVIVIPNGEVRTVTNLTKEWSRVVMDVGIPYDEDEDRVIEGLRRVGAELAVDEEIGRMILEPPEVLGIEALGQYQVTIRMLVKTLPTKQWLVARALRRRVKRMFAREGIQVPYPHQIAINQFPSGGAMEGGLATVVRQKERSE
jgi:moderate conductance mechanosensitive channel